MSDIYGDAPIKYLEQTPQRMRERIADLERQVAALKAELTTMEQLYGSEFNLNNNLIAVRAALTKFADVGREMVRITTTVRGEDEWGAIPKLWEMCLDERDALTEQVAALNGELETERMRLAACGVVAMADTPTSAVAARDMHPDYRSASCDDVARRVDECITLRDQVAALTKERDAWREDANISKASIDMLKGQREHQYDQLAALTKENERLKTVPMKYRRMAFNAQLQEENKALWERVETLEKALQTLLIERDGHYSTAAAWEAARAAMKEQP